MYTPLISLAARLLVRPATSQDDMNAGHQPRNNNNNENMNRLMMKNNVEDQGGGDGDNNNNNNTRKTTRKTGMTTNRACLLLMLLFSFLFNVSVIGQLLVNAVESDGVDSCEAANVTAATTADEDTRHNDKNNNLCTLYMAESTIPGAGMGLFAGHRSFAKYDFVSDSDLVIPVYDMQWNVNGEYKCGTKKKKWDFLWEEYTWRAANFYGMNEETDDVTKMKACSPGVGSVANCYLSLVNIGDDYNTRVVSTSGVSSQSPGAGAFTPYHGRRFRAKKDIPAGAELYLSYGSGYFRTRNVYEHVPLPDDYDAADKLVTRFLVRLRSIEDMRRSSDTDRHGDDNGSNSSSTDSEWRGDLWTLVRKLAETWHGESRRLFALPETKDIGTLHWLLDNGGTGMQHYNTSIQSLDWLATYGRCMDNIRDGVSSIPHAGRGAFATRFLPKGSLVAPVPLIHIPDRNTYTIFEGKTVRCEEDDQIRCLADHSKPVHDQLLLNYCFGHRESSLLLCPYGLLTSLVNHDGDNPNSKIVWAKDSDMTYPEWRDKPLKEWAHEEKAGLSFDFVALKDIHPDEEITSTYEYGPQNNIVNCWRLETHVTCFLVVFSFINISLLKSIMGMNGQEPGMNTFVLWQPNDGGILTCRRLN
jgi:hypothetical protein